MWNKAETPLSPTDKSPPDDEQPRRSNGRTPLDKCWLVSRSASMSEGAEAPAALTVGHRSGGVYRRIEADPARLFEDTVPKWTVWPSSGPRLHVLIDVSLFPTHSRFAFRTARRSCWPEPKTLVIGTKTTRIGRNVMANRQNQKSRRRRRRTNRMARQRHGDQIM